MCSALGMDATPDGLIDMRGETPEATLKEWVEVNEPHAFEDFGAYSLESLVLSEWLNGLLCEGRWVTRPIGDSRFDLLISDCPVCVTGSLEDTYLACLPLSPRLAFLAFSDDEILLNIDRSGIDSLVRTMNQSAVQAAHTYVYATDVRQETLVKKYLRKRA